MELFSQILENWKNKRQHSSITDICNFRHQPATTIGIIKKKKKNQRKRPQESKNSKNWSTKTGSNFWEDNKLTVGGNLRTWRNGSSGNETAKHGYYLVSG